jgi:hypothetical protein
MSGVNVNLPAWVQGVSEFQQLGLLNKATMCTLGIDVPYVALAKNPEEQKERLVRQSLILAFMFGMAPLHSTFLAYHFAKKIDGTHDVKTKKKLLGLKFEELAHLEAFQKAIQQHLPEAKDLATEALRVSVLKAKGTHLAWDLAAEGGLLASVGLLKVLFSEWQTGNKRFTGEKGLASEGDLNALYRKEHKKDPFGIPHFREIGVIVGASIFPFLFGQGIKQTMLQDPTKRNGLQRQMAKLAPHFDYNFSQFLGKRFPFLKEVPMLPLSGLMLVGFLLNMGDIASSRSPRDFKENTVRAVAFFSSMFIIGPMLVSFLNKGHTTIVKLLEAEAKAGKAPEQLVKIAKNSALKYIGIFSANLALMIGVVYSLNQMTKHDLKEDLKKLKKDTPQKTKTA